LFSRHVSPRARRFSEPSARDRDFVGNALGILRAIAVQCLRDAETDTSTYI
jgi:hypothetical protein